MLRKFLSIFSPKAKYYVISIMFFGFPLLFICLIEGSILQVFNPYVFCGILLVISYVPILLKQGEYGKDTISRKRVAMLLLMMLATVFIIPITMIMNLF